MVRTACLEDLEDLLAIYNDEVRSGTATFDLREKTLEEWRQWFDAHNVGNHPLIVAELDQKAVGYASLSSYREKEAYIATTELSVYVSRDYRRRGIARELMDGILRIARESGQIHCVVSVITKGNEGSVRLHEEFGFSYCGTMEEVGEKFGKKLGIVNYQLLI